MLRDPPRGISSRRRAEAMAFAGDRPSRLAEATARSAALSTLSKVDWCGIPIRTHDRVTPMTVLVSQELR